MLSIKRDLRVPAVLLVVAIASMIAFQVVGQRSGAAGGCACVVTVNLPAVIEGLNERAEAQLQLEQMRTQMIAEDEERKQRLTELRDAAVDIPEADMERLEAAAEEMARTALDYQAWRMFATEQLDIEKSLMLRELDRKINKALAELAQINGYQMVLTDDSAQQLGVNPESKTPREIQVKQQMTTRCILFTDPVVDITDQLVERMNNAFNAGG